MASWRAGGAACGPALCGRSQVTPSYIHICGVSRCRCRCCCIALRGRPDAVHGALRLPDALAQYWRRSLGPYYECPIRGRRRRGRRPSAPQGRVRGRGRPVRAGNRVCRDLFCGRGSGAAYGRARGGCEEGGAVLRKSRRIVYLCLRLAARLL